MCLVVRNTILILFLHNTLFFLSKETAQTVSRQVPGHSNVTSPMSLLHPFSCQGFPVMTVELESQVCDEQAPLHFCQGLHMNFGPR